MIIMRMIILVMILTVMRIYAAAEAEIPTPKPWPEQFHATLISNLSGALQLVNLWYDWPNGGNLNVEQDQLSEEPLYNVQWTNGTSFFIEKKKEKCQIYHFGVGILRPNWMEGGNYLGQRYMDGFLCNVWEKAEEFIWYYEDVITKKPVYWLLFTGKETHFMTFDVGAVLEDANWQAPTYCFSVKNTQIA